MPKKKDVVVDSLGPPPRSQAAPPKAPARGRSLAPHELPSPEVVMVTPEDHERLHALPPSSVPANGGRALLDALHAAGAEALAADCTDVQLSAASTLLRNALVLRRAGRTRERVRTDPKDCRHPVNARLGKSCAVCGSTVGKS